jgi:hypothetical protein
MNTLASEARETAAESVSVTDDVLTVNLADGQRYRCRWLGIHFCITALPRNATAGV